MQVSGSFADRIGRIAADDSAPAYRQLQKLLRQAIGDGTLQPGDALPAERELASDYRVSRITLRKALDGLASEGLVSRRQGAGTFVSERVEKSFSTLSSFTEDMVARGRHPHSEWLERASGTANPNESMALGLAPGVQVLRFTRVRFADGEPMALEVSTVPAACLPGVESVEASLYDALQKQGQRPVRALQRLRAIVVDEREAGLLGISARDAALLIERRGFLGDGRAVEFTQSLYRGDQYDFVAELQVDAG